ncbi:MAG: peptidoglycan DD-metalloendopeptidase family protein [Patescibacteria group bacterium]|nr:peptidoglycan DD-metalloendopeptidase family protein [Patescibacteria group bacterium]MDD5396290.1 peptidoglycan DD-metalloendopeptidase family protein [Patescibacteria group bacterium]
MKKAFFIIFIFCCGFFLLSTNHFAYASPVDDLQKQIEQQNAKIKQLQEQQKVYQDKIDQVQKQATTLKNQISILDNQIAKTNAAIKEKQESITETELSIQSLELQINNQYDQIDVRKEQLITMLQMINQNDNKNSLEIFLLNGNISEFLNQAKYLEDLQGNLQDNLEKMKLIKDGLETQQNALQEKKQTLSNLKQDLVQQKQQSSLERQAENNLLTQTRGAEWKYQALLAQAVSEQKKAERDMATAEQLLRKKIADQKNQEMLNNLEEGGGPLVLSWPVPQNVITTSFHDPEYPFIRSIGQHPAIDIRVAHGTAIRAPASGYVAKAVNAGMGYSYIMLVHRDGISTVYGHVSAIYVSEGQYVQRGSTIGRTGGIPGTPGAGPFCTGPHLHFEVRSNGIPTNPLNYLI